MLLRPSLLLLCFGCWTGQKDGGDASRRLPSVLACRRGVIKGNSNSHRVASRVMACINSGHPQSGFLWMRRSFGSCCESDGQNSESWYGVILPADGSV